MTAADKRTSSSGNSGDDDQDNAFNVWLSRGLHTLFDDVASEPIPAELLRLIEEDRNK